MLQPFSIHMYNANCKAFTTSSPTIHSSSFTRFHSNNMNSNSSSKLPKFVSVEEGDILSRSRSDGFRFRVVSYNILAQAYVRNVYYPLVPCLSWEIRSQRTLRLLKNLEADFLCLQEVDEYDEYYRDKMRKYGYSSVYIQRTGQKRDGCAIFYKQDKADLVLEERIEYNDLVNSVEDGTERPAEELPNGENNAANKPSCSPNKTSKVHEDLNDPRVRLKRDCVGIMSAFRLNDSSGTIIVLANTHLYWDPELADVKLAQAKYLLTRLARFRTQVADTFECNPPVMVAGDFNSTPGDKVYQYIVSGELSSSPNSEFVDQLPISLCSLYASTRGKEPLFTNYKPPFIGTLDYIFFSPSSSIRPVSVLELPESADAPDLARGLPNKHHPSDHLPVGADFEVVISWMLSNL